MPLTGRNSVGVGALAALVALVAGGALWAARGSDSGSTAGAGAPPTADVEAATPTDRHGRRFTLRYDETSTVTVSGAALQGTIALRGELVLAEDRSARRTRLVLARVETLAWTVEGEDVEGGQALLEGVRAERVWDVDGASTGVTVPADTRPEVARLLRSIALALQAPEPSVGDRAIEVPLGRARVHVEDLADERAVRWRADDYERIAGAVPGSRGRGEAAHAYELDAQGLRRARYRERLEVEGSAEDAPSMVTELELDLEPIAGTAPRLAWDTTPWVPAAQVASMAARRALEGRVAGLTFAQLLEDLRREGSTGVLPEHSRWLWRATGLLLLEPERAAELGRACMDGTLHGAARSLALDLLANVGHREAQAALREVLGDATVASGADYPSLLQRAVLVEAPEPATLTFYEQRMDVLEGPAYRASAAALGSLVGRVRDRDPVAARREVARLERALETAPSALDRRAVLMALGNARATEAEPRIVELAASGDVEVRAAAVRALGRLETEGARTQVRASALGDASPAVRGEALGALARLGARDDDLLALAGGVRAGVFTSADMPPLAGLARHTAAARGFDRAVGGYDALVSLLEAMLAHPGLPNDLAHQLAALRLRLTG